MRKKRKIAILLAVLLGIQLVIPGCGKKEDTPVTSEISEEVSSSGYESEIVGSSESVVESAVEEPEKNTKPSSFTTEYTIVDQKDGYFIVSKLEGTLYGLLDSRGKEVLALEYDKITFPESEDAQAVIVELEGKYGLYGYEGHEILPTEYEMIRNSGSNSTRYLVQKEGRQSIVGLDGTVEKELSGIYNQLEGNSFLELYYGYYTLDEKELSVEIPISYTTVYTAELEGVNDIICVGNPQLQLMDLDGNIIASVSEGERLKGLGSEKVFALSNARSTNGFDLSYRIFTLDTQSISEKVYGQIVKVDEETILANVLFASMSSIENVNEIDVFNTNGELEKTIEMGGRIVDTVIVSTSGKTSRIYDKQGNKLTDERYLSVDMAAKGFLIVQNLDGEYGIMDDKTGEMRIPFGGLDDEKSYGGKEWKNIYSFDDTLCIVTETGSGSMVSMF